MTYVNTIFAIDCILGIVECTWIRLAVNGACNQCRTSWSGFFTINRAGRIASCRWCSNRLNFTIQRRVGAANVTMGLLIQRMILRFWINIRIRVARFFFLFYLINPANESKWMEIIEFKMRILNENEKNGKVNLQPSINFDRLTDISSSDSLFTDNDDGTSAFRGKCVPGMSSTPNGSQKWSANKNDQRTTTLWAQYRVLSIPSWYYKWE